MAWDFSSGPKLVQSIGEEVVDPWINKVVKPVYENLPSQQMGRAVDESGIRDWVTGQNQDEPIGQSVYDPKKFNLREYIESQRKEKPGKKVDTNKILNPEGFGPGGPGAGMSPEEVLRRIRIGTKLTEEQRKNAAEQARKLILPQYAPQIKAARRNLADLKKERVQATRDTKGWFNQAESMINKEGRQAVRMSQKAIERSNKRIADNRGSSTAAEEKIYRDASRASARSDKSFTSRVQQGMAAEEAILLSGLNKQYKSMISEARSNLDMIKGERGASVAAARKEIVNQLKDQNREMVKLSLEYGGSGPGGASVEQTAKAWELASKFPEIKVGMNGNRRAASRTLYTQAAAAGVDPKLVAYYIKQNAMGGKNSYEAVASRAARAELSGDKGNAGDLYQERWEEAWSTAKKLADDQAGGLPPEPGAVQDQFNTLIKNRPKRFGMLRPY